MITPGQLSKLLPPSLREAVRPHYYRVRDTFWPAKPDYPWAGIPFDPNTISDQAYQRTYSADALANRRFYNVGSGTFRHKYWTNIDYHSDWYADQQKDDVFINHDLFTLQPLPVVSGQAEAVYTSHTVEHISDEACAVMFSEAYRMLKPGGYFRLTTPNIALDLAAWKRNDRDYFYYIDLYSHPKVCETTRIRPFKDASLAQIVLFVFASHVSMLGDDTGIAKATDQEIEEVFRTMSVEDALNHFSKRCTIEAQGRAPGYHMNWWTYEKAERMLREAGFSTIWKSGFGQSHSLAMRDVILFDKQDPKLSLYVEAVK